jgi:threonine/homoserine/homoserine lactone efflux protein
LGQGSIGAVYPYLLTGATLAFAAAVQPGPFQAYLVASTMTAGWRRTLPAAFAPIISDVPIVALVLLVLTRLQPAWLAVLRLGGGLFLLYLSARALAVFRRYREVTSAVRPSSRRTLVEAVGVNLLNPNPYISWSLVLGPLLIEAWREAPGRGVALVAGFYGTLVVCTAAIVLLLAGARSLGPQMGRASVGLSAAALAGFGFFEAWSGLNSLRGLL